MKFKILSLILFTFFATEISAQYYYGEEIIVGVKGGFALSTGSFNSANGIKPNQNTYFHHWGTYGGALFRYSGEKYLALQVEANFMQRGFQQHNDFSRTLNYVEIPLLSHIFFGAKKFRWFLNLGPEISFLINEKSTGSAESESDGEKILTEPIKNRFDYGILAGTGFEIHTKAGIYQLESRYEFGLGDVFSSQPYDVFTRSANQSITVTLGVLFNLKKY
jgi:hypothetical protein